jgi:hypothetical protein
MIDASLIKPQPIPLPNEPNIPNPVPLTFGMQYIFQLANVELAPHVHTDKNSHFTIVISGKLKFISGTNERIISAGDVVDTDLQEHSFISMEPNSIIINVTKYGTTSESIQADVNDIKVDLEKLSQTITNMKAIIGG